jgi:hypothetical protein
MCEWFGSNDFHFRETITHTAFETAADEFEGKSGLVDYELFIQEYQSSRNTLGALTYLFDRIKGVMQR